MGIWFFENVHNVACDMADARAQALPLVGGGKHDGEQIFSCWGCAGLGHGERASRFDTGMGWPAAYVCMVGLAMSRSEARERPVF